MLFLRPLLAIYLCFFAVPVVWVAAEETYSSGDMSWTVDSYGVLKTKQWPLVSTLLLTIEESIRKDQKTAKPAAQKPLPELHYGSDRSVTLLAMSEDKKKLTQTIQRSVRFDQERKAVRVLDIITSATDETQYLTLRYQTRWQPTIVPKLAKPLFISKPPEAKSPIAALIAAQETTLPVMYQLFGNDAKGWKRKITVHQDLLDWTYTGVLPAKQRVVLLHWLTFTNDVKADTVDKVISTLTSGGMPEEDSLSEDILKELANFPIPVKAPASSKIATNESKPKLAFVKAFADAIHVDFSTEVDQLMFTSGAVVKGTFDAKKVQLENMGRMRELPLAQIAAIRVKPSPSRVFLRDGTVLSGRLSWASATFQSQTLGKLALKPERLDQLVLRSAAADGKMDFKPVAWIAEDIDGQIIAWKTFPLKPLQTTWAGGRLILQWRDIASIHRLPAPAMEHSLILRDSSHLHVWLDLKESDSALNDCAGLASTPEALLSILDGNAPTSAIIDSALMLADGSVLVGDFAEPNLSWITKDGVIQIRATDIQQIKSNAPLYQIKTTTDTHLSGQPVAPTLSWKRDNQTMNVPWRLITELKPATKP